MKMESEKCVIVLDEALPKGVLANVAAILGVSTGAELPQLVGEDVKDGAGNMHSGIIRFPIPVLRGDAATLCSLRRKLYEPQFAELQVIDFSDLAQSCRTYDEFISRMSAQPESSLKYVGLAITGNKKMINRLTGSLPLLR